MMELVAHVTWDGGGECTVILVVYLSLYIYKMQVFLFIKLQLKHKIQISTAFLVA